MYDTIVAERLAEKAAAESGTIENGIVQPAEEDLNNLADATEDTDEVKTLRCKFSSIVLD